MNPMMEDLICDSRHRVFEWQRSLAQMTAGRLQMFAEGKDISASCIADLRRYIQESQELIAKYDPEGLTAGGDEVQYGGGLTPIMNGGTVITFALDGQRRAIEIRAFANQDEGLADITMNPPRRVGWISADTRSIRTLEAGFQHRDRPPQNGQRPCS